MSIPIIRFVFVFSCTVWATVSGQRSVDTLLDRDSLRVVITDSGLGGLAVAAEVDSLARATGRYRSLSIIFCNALPESDYGYNSMTTPEEQTRVFSTALEGMVSKFRPDVILIACNTLSVVYPHTTFARQTAMPVVGIVDLGVDMMEERLRSREDAVALLFGTDITVQSGDHIRELGKRGIATDRLVARSCGELASEIQLDARSDMVRTMVDMYVQEAALSIPLEGRSVIAGLFCTHYGFRSDAFEESLTAAGAVSVELVDPNHRMSRMLFGNTHDRTYVDATTDVRVYSRAALSAEEIASIGSLIRPTSRETADALASYTLQRDLFPFQRSKDRGPVMNDR